MNTSVSDGWFRFAGFVAVAVIGYVDYITGAHYGIGPCYLIPIITTAWRLGTTASLQLTFGAAVAWFGADIAFESDVVVSAWNALMRFVTFGAAGWAVGALHQSREQLIAANRELQRFAERDAELARTDELTGLLNRRGFTEQGRIDLARARRDESAVGMLFVDLDNFKTVNDTLGHAKGDEVLRAAAAAIRGAVRETDVCGRIGGDEFAVFCWNPTRESLEAAGIRIAERIKALDLSASGLGATTGVVWFEDLPTDVEALLLAADAEMYERKKLRKPTR